MTPPDPALVAELRRRCIEDPEVVAAAMESRGLTLAHLPAYDGDDPCDTPD